MDELLLKILELVVTISTLILVRYVVPYVKAKIGATQLETIEKKVKEAVDAAEQMIKTEKAGAQKKELVVDYITNFLIRKGIEITAEDLDILIEAAVGVMNKNK